MNLRISECWEQKPIVIFIFCSNIVTVFYILLCSSIVFYVIRIAIWMVIYLYFFCVAFVPFVVMYSLFSIVFSIVTYCVYCGYFFCILQLYPMCGYFFFCFRGTVFCVLLWLKLTEF